MEEKNNNTSNRELKLSRLLNAPIDLVWKVWTDPKHIVQWWGPNGFTNTINTMEVKKGGTWDFIMHGPDGTDFKNKNTFIEIVKHERIVFEHVTAPKHKTTVTFKAEGNKTQLNWHMLFESEEEFEQVVKVFKADIGQKQNVDKLETYLEHQQNKIMETHPVIIEKTYNASTAKVWKAITDVNEMRHWYFDLPEFKPELGFEFRFTGGHKDGIQYLHICKITEVVHEKKLAYSWQYDGYPGQSFVSFELFNEGAKTKLVLTHKGLETFPDHKDFAKAGFTEGWTHFTKALNDYLTK